MSAAADLLINLILRKFELPHLWAANLFLVSEFVLISFYYRNKIYKGKRVSLFYGSTSLSVLAFAVVWAFNGVNNLNGMAAAIIFSPILCLYGLTGLRNMLLEQRVPFLSKSSFFWANVAFIPYFTGSFFILLFSDYYFKQEEKNLLAVLWVFHDVFNVAKNLFLTLSLKNKDAGTEAAY